MPVICIPLLTSRHADSSGDMYSATSMPHISAHLSCLSVPLISASQCRLSVLPISATYSGSQCLLSVRISTT
ncbi:unnamed protein product [Staurois parvus]|uniref:Uncharacterized protein n=2 Tax=Staurois parvus TaxID=386267 RepID=A0ABN9BEU0_9NEOB|nr:unnamed protein product [Staurois parvus]